MCDVQAKLVAWLDRELPADEAIEVKRHVEQCQECRRWVARYGQVSETLEAYCDAVMVAKAPRRVPRWVPVLAGALVAASVVLLMLLRTRVDRSPVLQPMVAASVTALGPAAAREPAPRRPAMRRHQAAQAQRVQRPTQVQPMDTAIQIAIPAEAMFPPGAMPTGINFIADVRIAPDGSVQLVRLRQ
ncbi:MAG TPA: zf-HC2 domain-containing protein [Candidatus Acidoferrum sp.]